MVKVLHDAKIEVRSLPSPKSHEIIKAVKFSS